MYRNYVKIALRNLWKQKTFSAINIIGLATGLCCFLLIALYVTDELSYDRYNEKADRIYRINTDLKFGGTTMHFTQTSDMMGEVLKKDYPQVEAYTRIFANSGNKLIKKGTQYINEINVANVDSTFFRLFTLPAIAGNTVTALDEPNTVVLTKSTALKYFGSTDILGKIIETSDERDKLYKITAVVADVPENSHFHFDFFFSMKNAGYQWGQYLSHNFHTYLLLKPGTDAKAFEKAFDTYITKYVLPEAKQFMQISSMDDMKKAGNSLAYSLLPLTKIHLYSDYAYELSPPGNIRYIYVFSAVALFILLIACVNFMNLTTARSAGRAKEVGIRKVLGTERRALVAQFLSESTVTVLLAMLIAMALAYVMLPLFNGMAGKTMTMASLLTPYLLPFLLLLPVVVGLLAGSYPAFYLSAFRPIAVLKGSTGGTKKAGLRSALVVFQFTTSIMLIIGTIIIFRQLHYIQTKELGYKKEQVLIINDAYALKSGVEAFKNEVVALPGVTSGTLSSYLPVANSSRNDNMISREAVMDARTGFNMQTWGVDYDYIKTMGMHLLKGRDFSKEYGTDSAGVIINETTAKILGYADPIGKDLYRSSNDASLTKFTIIGVVQNFNFESLKQSIGPLALFLEKNTGLAAFKIAAADVAPLITSIEAKWRNMAPGLPFSYRFLDESFAEMYRDEQRVGKIALTFSIIAILIACLGLFGLAAFVAEQRTKEIGIRKVLGASVHGLVGLLSKDFIKLVVVAFFIAAPLAWWAMHKWLQDFEYRIAINWTVFAAAALIALFIAVATIGFQAVRAAMANPVKNLRSE